MVPKYLVVGKRWFARTYGNTYHTVKIVDLSTGETIFQSERTYGYGGQWKTTAYNWLIKRGLVSDADRHNHELNRKRFIYEVSDVSRRKDL